MNDFIPNDIDRLVRPEIDPHKIDLRELANKHLRQAVDLAMAHYFKKAGELSKAISHMARFDEIAAQISDEERQRLLDEFDASWEEDADWQLFKFGGYFSSHFGWTVDLDVVFCYAAQAWEVVCRDDLNLDYIGSDFHLDMLCLAKLPRVERDDNCGLLKNLRCVFAAKSSFVIDGLPDDFMGKLDEM